MFTGSPVMLSRTESPVSAVLAIASLGLCSMEVQGTACDHPT